MAKLTIIKESKPNRCEVCHQSDVFDAVTNSCARCGDLSNMQLSAPVSNTVGFNTYGSRPGWSQVVIPKNVAIDELADNFTIAYRSGSFKNFLPFMVLGVNLINFFTRPWSEHYSPLIFLLALISVVAVIVGFINLVFKKTYLTITADQIIQRNKPYFGFGNHTIAIDDVADCELINEMGWDKLTLVLKSSRRIELVRNRGDHEGMEFIERVLKERLAKKRD